MKFVFLFFLASPFAWGGTFYYDCRGGTVANPHLNQVVEVKTAFVTNEVKTIDSMNMQYFEPLASAQQSGFTSVVRNQLQTVFAVEILDRAFNENYRVIISGQDIYGYSAGFFNLAQTAYMLSVDRPPLGCTHPATCPTYYMFQSCVRR